MNIISGSASWCSYGACSEATLASSVSVLMGSQVRAAGFGFMANYASTQKSSDLIHWREGQLGILLVDCWVANLFDMVCISDQIILLKLAMGKDIYTIISVYGP